PGAGRRTSGPTGRRGTPVPRRRTRLLKRAVGRRAAERSRKTDRERVTPRGSSRDAEAHTRIPHGAAEDPFFRQAGTTSEARAWSPEPVAQLEGKSQLVLVEADRDGAAVFEPAEQNFVRERVAHFLLDDAAERSRAECRLVPLPRQPRARFRCQRNRDAPIRE